jgi:hypothetical protein
MQQKEKKLLQYLCVPVFFLRILWYSPSDDQPENNLAKIGYITKYESYKTRSFYIPHYLLELIIKIEWSGKRKS